MDKELEKVIYIYNTLKRREKIIQNIEKDFFFRFAETVLKELEALQETIESKDRLLAITTIELNTAEEELERLQEKNKYLKKERENEYRKR